MRSILVPVADRPECVTALAAAYELAGSVSANVLGLHVRPHQAERKRGVHDIPFMLRTYSDWQKFLTDDEIRLDSKAAAAFFRKLSEENGFTLSKSARFREEGRLAVWHEFKGSPENAFSIAGPMADLIVVSRPKNQSSVRAQSFMLSALLCSGRPLLILPQRKRARIGRKILIAWNQSVESAAAVSAAIPLLQRAESVHIVTAGVESRLGPKAAHVQQYLKYWGVNTQRVRTPGKSPEDEIVRASVDHRSDLLVMGAYSRSRWRETVFGGVTQHILSNTSLPTLALHR